MENRVAILLLFISVTGVYSCGQQDEHKDLSGKYWYASIGSPDKTISSKIVRHHNKIYPEVTDYVYDDKFIIAEQKPEKEAFISSLGSDFLDRYDTYCLYKENSGILNDPFYEKLRGVVEKDSVLYRFMIERGAVKDSLNKLSIAIQIAQSLIENDPYYLNMFNNKLVYWIIYHPTDTMIGPLTRKEYLGKKSVLGIPNKLKLKFEH